MKVLVTGGSGFLGTHIRQFFDADDFSRRSGCDILSFKDLTRIHEYDLVIHLAAFLDKSPNSSGQVFLTNVEGTVNVLREMKEGAAFIFASTKDVYGRFADGFQGVPETCQTIYAGQSALEWSKLIAERYVEYYANARKFRACILRLSTIYAPKSEGNVSNFVGHYAEAINLGERFGLPAKGLPTRDLLHVEDLAKACLAFNDSVINHGLYNIGGGIRNAMTLKELVGKLEAVSGLQAVIDDESDILAPVPMNFVTDISLIRQELDWSPTISLENGLKTLF